MSQREAEADVFTSAGIVRVGGLLTLPPRRSMIAIHRFMTRM